MGIVKTLKEHETTIVEMAAVLTAAPRWVITFAPIDRARLDAIIISMGGVWDALSAGLSIAFAVVEIWATAMIMRAFNLAKDKKDKAVLFVAWVASLVVLAVAQIPPLYASLNGVSVTTLGVWQIAYVVAVSIAAFTVIAGVSYADKVRTRTDTPHSMEDLRDTVHKHIQEYRQEQEEQMVSTQNNSLAETNGNIRIIVDSYDDFKAKVQSMNSHGPQSGADVERQFKLSHNTAYRYWHRLQEEKS